MTTWLNGIVGETAGPIVSLIVSIILIAIVILVLVWVIRIVLSGRFSLRHNPDLRLQVVDATAIDNRRKLVLVRRDNVEHLILIGGQNDLVVETGIGASVAQPQKAPNRTSIQPTTSAMPEPAKPAQRPAAKQNQAPINAPTASPPPIAPVAPTKAEPRPVEIASIPQHPQAKPAIAPAPVPTQHITPQPKTEKPAAPDVELASSTDFDQGLDAEMDALINTLTTKNG
ncbi:MAG: hypothetical protein WA921_08760 [Ahrensia sp.]